jgi:nucleoside-diphosphate-sugar epimerase
MRILVIGGTAFIGPHVVTHLTAMHHTVALFHRGQTEAALPPDVTHIHGERHRLPDFAHEFRRFDPEIVLDMIPIAQYEAQAVMSIFMGIARRVVAISSIDVYRAYGRLHGTEPGPVEPVPLTEDAALRQALYPYRGKSEEAYDYEKILVEQAVMNNASLPGTILRLPFVYGPRDYQHRLYEYVKWMTDNRPAIVLDDGWASWRGTWGYVENVAAAIALAVTDNRAAGRIYNVGEASAVSMAERVCHIGRVMGWNGDVVAVPRSRLPAHLVKDANTNQHLVVDITRIREELGYVELVPPDEAFRRTAEWERTHPPQEIDPQSFDYAAEDAVLHEWAR